MTPCPKLKKKKDEQYLSWIRKQPCIVCYRTPCEAHHVRTAANSGMGIKPGDDQAVPLCPLHHRELHQIGVQTFCEKYWVDIGYQIIRHRRVYRGLNL